MSFIVVSGYTYNTAYETEIEDLRKGLKKYNIPYTFYGYESFGEWTRNTMEKARLIQRAMIDYPNDDVIWIDADAVIKARPDFFYNIQDKKFDICCHYKNGKELLSGTLYIRNNDACKALVEDWVNYKGVNWDQRILQNLIENKYRWMIKRLDLPYTYVKIKARNEDIKNVQGVIGHKQISRSQRNVIGCDRSINNKWRKKR